MYMKTQSFVITWWGSHLWKSLIKYFADKWCKLLVTSHWYYQELENMENENIVYMPWLDLTNDEHLDSLYKKTKEFMWNEKFNVLNCVGWFPDYRITCDINISEAKRVLDSNVLCVFSVANRLIPIMCENWWWHFVWFSMHTTYQNYPKMAIFSASKVALEAFIKWLSNEYYKYGVNANIVSLSTLKTDIELKMKPQWDYENWLMPDEVCKIVDSLIETTDGLVNGSVIHTYKHSDTYFGQSYYDRINTVNS